MEVTVLLFAQARQIAGSDSVSVSLDDNASVADLRKALAEAHPDLESLLSRSSIALDQKYAIDADVVWENVEVAVIPPVSGG